MLSKILTLVAICVGVYIVSQRHKLFPAIFGDKIGADRPNPGNWKQNQQRQDQGSNQDQGAIEELDYDPKTGHYRVKKSKNGRS